MESLPVLDYGGTRRDALIARILEVMEDIGFLYLDNIPGYNEDELRWCVNFFYGLPLEKRMEIGRRKYNPQNENMYRGYFGLNQVGSSFKEGFEMGLDLKDGDADWQTGFPLTEKNSWPRPDAGQDSKDFDKFRETMERYYRLMYDVAVDLLRMISKGLGLNEHYFDPLYSPKTLSTLRLINYPVHNFKIPEDAYSKDDGKLLSTAAHRDSTTLTLLTTFDYEGLQVEKEGGGWLDVKTRKNSLVVNLGETLSKMTGRRVKATIHRVLAIGRPRQSVPFFLEPAFHAMVPKSIPANGKVETEMSVEEHDQEDTFKYGPWLMEYMSRFVEYQNWLSDTK